MSQLLKKHWYKLTVSVLVLAIVVVVAGMVHNATSQLPVIARASDFSLLNTDAKPVQLSGSDGEVRLLTFIYTRCASACPLTTFKMSQMQNDLKKEGVFGKNVDFISITLDPAHDTGQVLQQYASKYGADLHGGWQFLYAEPAAIQSVLVSYGVQTDVADPQTITHTQVEFLIDKSGNIRKRYDANLDTKQVEKDIQSLL